MKYVKLEHRLHVPFGTIAIEFVNYETNDNNFEQKAENILNNNYNKHKKEVNILKNQAHNEQLKCEELQKEFEELRKITSLFKRIFSKEYKNKSNELNRLYYNHNEKHAKLNKEVYKLEHDFEEQARIDYYSLKNLLKKSGYSLHNTSPMANTSITIEVWHKNN